MKAAKKTPTWQARCRAKIREMKKRTSNHRKSVRWFLKHGEFTRAAEPLLWAEQASAFAEGVEYALRVSQEGEKEGG